MLLSWYTGIVTKPVETIRELVDEKPLGLGIATFIIVMVVSSLVNFSGLDSGAMSNEDVIFPDITAGLIISLTIVTTIWLLPMYAILAYIPQLVTKFFNGEGTYTGYLSTTMMITSIFLPFTILSAVVWLVLGGGDAANNVSGLVSLVGGLWAMVLCVIAIRENYRLTTGGAVISFLISAFVGLFAFLILAAILVLLGFGVFFLFGLEIVSANG